MCIYFDQFTVCDQLQHSSSSRVTLYLPVPIINIKFYKKCKNSNSIVYLFLMKLGIDGDPIFIDLVVPDNWQILVFYILNELWNITLIHWFY